MLVECNNCGAPLDVAPRDQLVTCRYCDRTNRVRSLKTTAMRTPDDWRPPPTWRPPPDVPEPSERELRHHRGIRHQVTRARNHKKGCSLAGCFVVIIPLLPFVISFVSDGDLQALFERFRGGEVTPLLGTVSLSPPGGQSTLEGSTTPSRSATEIGPSCSGRIPLRPHVSLSTGQPTLLTARTRGTEDLTLLLRHPAGEVVCDDDSGGERQALLVAALEPGVHQVWVGTFAASDASIGLDLEWDTLGAMPGSDGLAATAEPELGVLEAAGEHALGSYVGEARGLVAASVVSPDCDGYLHPRPQVRIHAEDTVAVDLVTESDDDLVMLLRAADGTVHCDDDSGGGRQPQLIVSLPPGDHAVWVGTFQQNERAPFAMTATASPDAPKR